MNDIEERINEIMKPKGPSGWSLFGQIILGIPIGLLGTMGVAKCIEPMWTWFITPVTGAAVPAFWVLVGFMVTIGFFTMNLKKRDLDEPDNFPLGTVCKITFTRLIASVLMLGVGWFIHQMV